LWRRSPTRRTSDDFRWWHEPDRSDSSDDVRSSRQTGSGRTTAKKDAALARSQCLCFCRRGSKENYAAIGQSSNCRSLDQQHFDP
jgi:hypothetical protein